MSPFTAVQPFIGQLCTAPTVSQASSRPLGDSVADNGRGHCPLAGGGTLHPAGRRGEEIINKLDSYESVISAVQGIKTS